MNKSMPIKKRPGRPKYEPTKAVSEQVCAMVTAGLSHERIASILKIDLKTLYKYYRDEMDNGKAEALKTNTVTLMAAAKKGSVPAMIYLQKCLGGNDWKERIQTEQSGETVIRVVYDK